MTDGPKEHAFEIVFEAEGRSVGKMRNEITVSWIGGNEGPWEMATDEGGFHSGENTAPPPLPIGQPGSPAAS